MIQQQCLQLKMNFLLGDYMKTIVWWTGNETLVKWEPTGGDLF